MTTTLLPLQPLLDVIAETTGARSSRQVGEVLGRPAQRVRKWRACGVSAYLADELAVQIRLHPFAVWGWPYFDADLLRAEQGPGRKVLSARHAAQIRELHAQGVAQREIARRFGVDHSSVHNIVHGKTWAS